METREVVGGASLDLGVLDMRCWSPEGRCGLDQPPKGEQSHGAEH